MRHQHITLLAVMLLSAAACGAQERPAILLGASGGESFGNLSLGPMIEVELPLAHHFEWDVRDTFSPLESHIALGHGWANQAEAGGIVWIEKSFGVDGLLTDSTYDVPRLVKSNTYTKMGASFRSAYGGVPLRIFLNYVREVSPPVSHGVESSHLNAGNFRAEATIACSKHFCYRTVLDMSVGHILEQGNPECDGTWGATTCRRRGQISGSGTMGFLVQIGR
jgi:hypothetical protein